jgi:prepilin-type N-terminal cleavage/methylation domain-containing protein
MRTLSADETSMIKRIRRRLRNESGFGLIELMITLVILSISIAALLSIFLGSAVSLARTGREGTATVIMDRVYEYYRRGPWADIRLVAHGPGGSWGAEDSNVTGDTIYTGQCSSCPAGTSSVLVDDNAAATSAVPPRGDWYGSTTANNTSTCNPAQGTGDPDTDSTAPITNCLAEATVFGADGKPYRVYTYMRYACGAEPWQATKTYATNEEVKYGGVYYKSKVDANTNNQPPNPTFWDTEACAVDYSTKVVTVIVRLLNHNLGVADTAAKGVLAKQTVVFSYGSFTTVRVTS